MFIFFLSSNLVYKSNTAIKKVIIVLIGAIGNVFLLLQQKLVHLFRHRMPHDSIGKGKIDKDRLLTPGMLPPGTGFIMVYIFSPPEFDESRKKFKTLH